MRRALLIPVGFAVLALATLWASGGFDALGQYAAAWQREFQNAMARGLRALRGGQPGALAALMGVCFAYGFVHAAGPGHGKVLIGGYGVGRQVRMFPLAVIALASSLAQATTAVLLAYGGLWLLGWGREQLIGVTEEVMAPVGYGAIGLIGLWLLARGARKLLRQARAERAGAHAHERHDHNHAPDAHDETCGCGHSHGPSLDDVEGLTGLRDGLLLIGGIALRPCTGALFVLVLTWQMGIPLAGLAGAYAMGLGTASVTVMVALAAVGLRGGALTALAGTRTGRLLVPVLELTAGALVALIALQLLRLSL